MARAYQDFLSDRDALALDLIDLERRDEDLELDRLASDLALEETLARYQRGLADDQELARARWTIEETKYEERLLALDGLIAEVQLRDLTSAREE